MYVCAYISIVPTFTIVCIYFLFFLKASINDSRETLSNIAPMRNSNDTQITFNAIKSKKNFIQQAEQTCKGERTIGNYSFYFTCLFLRNIWAVFAPPTLLFKNRNWRKDFTSDLRWVIHSLWYFLLRAYVCVYIHMRVCMYIYLSLSKFIGSLSLRNL